MTTDTVWTALQIAVPFAAFGVLLIGGASSTVGRWLGRGRRPFGNRKGSRPLLSAVHAHSAEASMSLVPAGPAAAAPHVPVKRAQAEARRAA